MDYIISTVDRDYRSRGGLYPKDNPVRVKMRDDARVYFNGEEVSKLNPCFKFLKPGRYRGRFAGLMSLALNTIERLTRKGTAWREGTAWRHSA